MSDIETVNDSLIASNGGRLTSVIPLNISTRQQAYRAAAYLVSMAVGMPDEEKASSFEDVLSAVQAT